ncbi:MAG: hypothetical protein ACTSVU_09975 [Promethearchaeota archaeon]
MQKKQIYIFLIIIIISPIFLGQIDTLDARKNRVYQNLSSSMPNKASDLLNETYSTPNTVNLNYTLKYESRGYDTEIPEDIFNINLIISGNQSIYGNGTIDYFLPTKNISDSLILEQLQNIFSSNQLEFFQNHQKDDSFQTNYSLRRESLTPNFTEDFSKNASYTIFWINTTGHLANYIRPIRSIKFFNVEDPFKLSIVKNLPDLAEDKWDPSHKSLQKNVRILNVFKIGFYFQDTTQINLYYDKVHCVLLRADIDYNEKMDGKSNSIDLSIWLNDSNLDFNFLETNPYHIAFQQKILVWSIIGSGFALLSVIIIFLLRKKKKSEKKMGSEKRSLLDQI